MKIIILLLAFAYLFEESTAFSDKSSALFTGVQAKQVNNLPANHRSKIHSNGHKTRLRQRRHGKDKKEEKVPEIQEKVETIVFSNEMAMLKMGENETSGAIAYTKKEDKFFGKSIKGWSPFMMGNPVSTKKVNGQHGQRYRTKSGDGDVPPTLRTQISNSEFNSMKIAVEHFDNHVLRPIISPPKLKLVALNEPLTGDMGGIKKVNYKCQQEAYEAGIDGLFRAFLATKEVNLAMLLSPAHSFKSTIVNIMGKKLFESYEELRDLRDEFWKAPGLAHGPVITPIYSFNGSNVIYDENWPENLVWHGQLEGDKASTKNCNGWKSSNSTDFGIASDYLYKGLFSMKKKEACNESLIVLCIETGTKNVSSEISYKTYLEKLTEYEWSYKILAEDQTSDSLYDNTETTENNDSLPLNSDSKNENDGDTSNYKYTEFV